MEYVLGINIVLFSVLVVVLGIFAHDEARQNRREEKRADQVTKEKVSVLPLPEAA